MNKVTGSSLLLLLQKAAERSIGLVSTLILARILTPDDFGTIAVAMLSLWFVEALSKTGADLYIIQKESFTDDEVNSAWTVDLILKCASFIVLVLISPFIAYAKNDSSFVLIIVALGLILPMSAIANPGLWLLRREQRYYSIVKMTVLIKFATLCIVVPIAYCFQSYWAIIVGLLVSALLRAVFSYRISKYRPTFSLSNFSRLWQFSKWLIPQEVLGFFRNHVDTLIVSGRFSTGDLGAYNNMKYFSSIPMLQIITPIAAPLHAELGKVRSNVNEMQFQSSITFKILSFLGSTIAAITFVCSEELVGLFLGEQWLSYHSVFGAMSLLILPFILIAQASRILMVMQRTKDLFIYEVLSTLSILVVLFSLFSLTLSQFSLLRFAIDFVLGSFFYLYASHVAFGRLNLLNFFTIIFSFGISIISLFIVESYFFQAVQPLGKLILFSLFGVSIGLVLLLGWFFVFASSREKKAIRRLIQS